jgi:hypothetical protein
LGSIICRDISPLASQDADHDSRVDHESELTGELVIFLYKIKRALSALESPHGRLGGWETQTEKFLGVNLRERNLSDLGEEQRSE